MRGFSLFECLIYLALFSLLITGAFIGMVALNESADRNRAISLLEDEGPYLLAKLQYQIESGVVPTIELSAGRLTETVDGTPVPLSDNAVSVIAAGIKEVDTASPSLRSIAVLLSLSATSSSGAIFSRDFSGTSYLSP